MPVEVTLDQVNDGAVLAEDVLDSRGNVLLAAGTQLTAAHIALVQRRGIQTVKLLTPDEPDGAGTREGPDPAEIEACLLRHDEMFAQSPQTPLMEAIRKASRAHIEAGNLPPG
jgi:hypothetical protein